MQLKWVAIDKSGGEPKVMRKVDAIQDRVGDMLAALAAGQVRLQSGLQFSSCGTAFLWGAQGLVHGDNRSVCTV
jgi:hypothetical protein